MKLPNLLALILGLPIIISSSQNNFGKIDFIENENYYPPSDYSSISIESENTIHEESGKNKDDETVTNIKLGYLYKILKYLSDKTHKSSLSKSGIRFLLYTLKNPTEEQEISADPTLHYTNWDSNANVKIIIHGYKESGKDKSSQKTKDAYMATGRSENIIIVDWQTLSKESNYFNSAKNTKIVGETVAEFIFELEQQGYIESLKQVHIIGFSLGAQTAGIVGYLIQERSGGRKLGRITGLDPAGPGFDESVDKKDRIDESDADFVDVIHCDRGKLVEGGYRGTLLVSGHADFYPNGGSVQPGCSSQSLMSKIFSSSCSHTYCPKLFQQSILGRVYIGCQCQDWETFESGVCLCDDGHYMGEFCSTDSQGEFYLRATIPDNELDLDDVPHLHNQSNDEIFLERL